jgi:penicillin amidase
MPTFFSSLLQAPVKFLNRNAQPQTNGTLKLPGLRSKVEVFRDAWGVPHIYAADTHDLFFTQGFIHAQERLFQMEMNRRMALGQLAGAFGPVALDTDRLTRTLGFKRTAEIDLARADASMQETLAAYAAGVNAFLQLGKLPVEFTLTGVKPGLWTPLDTMAFARVMVFQLTHGWSAELVRAQLIEKLGPELAADLEIKFPERDVPTLPEGIVFNRLHADGMLQAEQGPYLNRGLDGGGRGSNAWAIAGWRSTTGQAILCNDMHLHLTTPGIWHMAHLVGGDYEVTGVGLPGAPGILVGHNARIAWGATLALTDTQDLFIEKMAPDNPRHYEFKGEWHDCEVTREEIAVKGRKTPHVEEVRVTRHGPLINDVIPGANTTVALQSYALRPSPTIAAFLAINRAQGWDDFVEALRPLVTPNLNLVYADVEGNIGHWVSGIHPIRAQGQGNVPAPGWTGDHEWIGEIPFEQMPHALNPERGYIVSCNHRLVPDDYAHYLGSGWMNGYRAQRITAEIERKGRLSPEDCRALHIDFHSLPGLELVKHLDGFTTTEAEAALGLKHLREWNGWLGADSIGGTLYQTVLSRLVYNLIAPKLGRELFDRFMGGKGPHPVLTPTTEFSGHSTVTVLEMLGDPDSAWVKDAGGRDALVEKSLKEAVRWLKAQMGEDPHQWRWGDVHMITLPHPLGIQPPLDKIFNLGPAPIGGDTDTVCQTAFLPDAPYRAQGWAPSYREIVDMGDLGCTVHIAPPGNSGLLGNPHYGDLLPLWLKGEYIPATWEKAEVEKGAEKLVLSG